MIELAVILASPAAMYFPFNLNLSSETIAAAQPYWDCVVAKSISLEPANEAIELTVAAARTSCEAEQSILEAGIAQDLLSSAADRAIAAIDGKPIVEMRDPQTANSVAKIMAPLEKRLQAEAVMRIAEARAARRR